VTDVVWWYGHGTRADRLNLVTEERGEVFSCIDSGVIVRRLTQQVLECLPKSATVYSGNGRQAAALL